LNEHHLKITENWFKKQGEKTIFFSRFIPVVRHFISIPAGIGKMNYRKYLMFDILGGFLWIFSLTLAGYMLGEVEWIRKHIDLVCLGIIFISVFPMILSFLKSKMGAKNA
jgi:membrane-associated protein